MADVSAIDFGDGIQRNVKDTTARRLATVNQTGQVKPDGSSITIDGDGTLHGAMGSSWNVSDGVATFVGTPVTRNSVVGLSIGDSIIPIISEET